MGYVDYHDFWSYQSEGCHSKRIIKANQVVLETPRLLGQPSFFDKKCHPTCGTGIMCGRTDFCPMS